MDYKDWIGLFDIKTGQLSELIELNAQFEGSRFALTDDMIMIGRRSDPDRSTIDSCTILDRKNGNKSFVPGRFNQPTEYPVKGLPSLSPNFPLIAIATADSGLQIWKLDSKAESLTQVKTLPDAKVNVYSQLQKIWHPTEPTVAWVNDQTQLVNWYNAETDQLTTNDSVSILRDVIATPTGWLVAGSQKMVEFDLSLNVIKTYLPTRQIDAGNPAGEFDQGITAEGTILRSGGKAKLRAIQLQDNRIETLTIEAFVRQFE